MITDETVGLGGKLDFLDHFADLPDPRQALKVLYPLDEVLLLTLCARCCAGPMAGYLCLCSARRSSRFYAVKGRRDGDALVIAWIRRTRFDAPWLDGVDAPLGEAEESYEVDLLDDAGAVVRTLATDVPTVTYAAADQIADFGAVQSTVKVRVHQLSARVGRGMPAEGVF